MTEIDWLAVARKAAEDTIEALAKFTPAPTTTKHELPKELGSIIRWQETHLGAIAEREAPNQWFCNWDADTHTDAEVIERISGRPYVALEPVPVTAKRVLTVINATFREDYITNDHLGWNVVAAQFGVTDD